MAVPLFAIVINGCRRRRGGDSFIGTVNFTGWSFIGKSLSKLMSIKVYVKQAHTIKAPKNW